MIRKKPPKKKQAAPQLQRLGSGTKNILNMDKYNTNRSLLSSLFPKNPCQGCGGSQGIVTEVDRSTGNPHSYRLDCGDCGRFQRWIGQREFDRKIGKQGGRENA